MALDLSKLSDEDLAAVQSGDMSKVSDEGLAAISGQPADASPKSKLPVDDKDTSDALEKMAGKPDEESEKMMGKEATQKEAHAFGTGVVKGATFGMSPNIGAVGDVAADVAEGKQGLSGIGAKWREYQQSRKAANKKEEDESPAAFTTGEVTGGLGTMLVPGLGEAAGGGKLLEAAKGISPAAKTFLTAGKDASIGAKLAGKATAGAIEGAPIGAAYGFGDSDKNIEDDPVGLAKDTASGAGMGSLTGAALTAGAKGVSDLGKAGADAAGNLANESDYLQKAKQLYNLGKQGVNLSSTSGRDIAALMSNKNIPDDVVNNWLSVDQMNGQKVGDTIQKAVDSGTKINISGDLYDATKNIFSRFIDNPNLQDLVDPKSKQVIDLIYKSNGGDVSPIEAKALRDTLYDLGGKLSGMSGDVPVATQRQAFNLAKSIDASLKAQISGYGDAAQKFAEFRSLIPETALQPGVPLDKRTQYLGDLKNKQNKLLGATKDLLNQAQMPGDQPARAGLAELGQNMQQLKMTNPSAYNAMGGDQGFQNLRDKANLISGMNQAQGINPNESLKRSVLGQMVGSGEGLGLNIANKLGRAVSVTGQSAPVQLSTKLFSSSNDQLANLAKTMQGDPATKYLGETLEKALGQKTNVLKNAVLFRMLQDPTYRGLLKQVGYEPEGNK